MSVVQATGEALKLHDYVEFQTDVWAAKRGTRGTIVDVYYDRDVYTIEISDEAGRMVELIPAQRKDIRLLERA